MAGNDHVRIEISFRGGQTVSVQVPPDTADALERALGDERTPVFHLDADDGRYAIALGQVVFVKRNARESRIGFGGVS
jgi:hypothetical protein